MLNSLHIGSGVSGICEFGIQIPTALLKLTLKNLIIGPSNFYHSRRQISIRVVKLKPIKPSTKTPCSVIILAFTSLVNVDVQISWVTTALYLFCQDLNLR